MDHFISASANATQAAFPMVPLNPWQVPFVCKCFINKRLHFVKGTEKDLYPSKKKEGNVPPAGGLQTEGKMISSFNLVHNCMVSNLYFQHHVFGSAKLSCHLSSSAGLVWLCSFQYTFPRSLGIIHSEGFTIASFPSWISSTSSFPLPLTVPNSLQPLLHHCIFKLRVLFHSEILQNCFLLLSVL